MNFMSKYAITVSFLFIQLLASAQTSKKVLFLGNSYTAYNNLATTIQEMAYSDANDLVFDQHTPGGQTLMGHSSNATSLQKIKANQWDYVVLQDQSQLPSFPWNQVQSDVLPYAEILVDSIRSANECAIPLFFNTWGRENGDSQWDSINTFEKMNDRLFYTYGLMAERHSGKRAPVGMAFAKVKQDQNTTVSHADLYTSDGSHPSQLGSYLAACVFYELIFETSVEGNTYLPASIANSQAFYLQTVAHEVVNNVDTITNNFTLPIANFEFQQSASTVAFSNSSIHSFSYHWEFGNGDTSLLENPNHTYTSSGTFIVELTANYCERSSVHLDTVTIQISSVSSISEDHQDLEVFPNPAQNHFQVNSTQNQFELYSIQGVHLGSFKTNQPIQLDLPVGTYIVSTPGFRKKLVIQQR
jgi:PKD repeat protein